MTAVVAVAVLGAGAGVVSAGATPAPSANLTAYTITGTLLPPDPTLAPGAVTRIVVTGYAPGALVAIRRAGTTKSLSRQADPHGVLSYVYAVPSSLADGEYVLTFVGLGPLSSPVITTPPPSRPDYDTDPFIVVVPNSGFFPYRIARTAPPSTPPPQHSPTPSAGVSGIGSTRPGGGHTGGLSSTGANIVTPLVIALIALLLGAIAMRSGLRQGGRVRDP